MKTLEFFDDETGDSVLFYILSAAQYKSDGYVLVTDQDPEEFEDLTVYVLKAEYIEGEDIIYELVEDEELLDQVYPILEEEIDNFEN